MQVVLSSDQRPHEDDQEITKASDEGNDPDGHSQQVVGQQVLEGRDAVSIGLTGPDVGRVRAVLECLEIAGKRTEEEDGRGAARVRSEILAKGARTCGRDSSWARTSFFRFHESLSPPEPYGTERTLHRRSVRVCVCVGSHRDWRWIRWLKWLG